MVQFVTAYYSVFRSEWTANHVSVLDFMALTGKLRYPSGYMHKRTIIHVRRFNWVINFATFARVVKHIRLSATVRWRVLFNTQYWGKTAQFVLLLSTVNMQVMGHACCRPVVNRWCAGSLVTVKADKVWTASWRDWQIFQCSDDYQLG